MINIHLLNLSYDKMKLIIMIKRIIDNIVYYIMIIFESRDN